MNNGRFSIGFELQDYFLIGSTGKIEIECWNIGSWGPSPHISKNDRCYYSEGILPIIPAVFSPSIYITYNPIRNLAIRLNTSLIYIIPEGDVLNYILSIDLSLGYLIRFFEPSLGVIYFSPGMYNIKQHWGIKSRINFLIYGYKDKIGIFVGLGTTVIPDSSGNVAFGLHFNFVDIRYNF